MGNPVSGRGSCQRSRMICSSANILALVVALGATRFLISSLELTQGRTRHFAVLAILITTSVLRCFLARARPRKTCKTTGVMVGAAERRRQRQLDWFCNQAQLDVEYWVREMEREAQQREEEEESVPPPYSRHPMLPSWSEHERLRAQEEGQGQGASGEFVEDGSPSNSQPASAKGTQAPLNAGIRYPPPMYLP